MLWWGAYKKSLEKVLRKSKVVHVNKLYKTRKNNVFLERKMAKFSDNVNMSWWLVDD